MTALRGSIPRKRLPGGGRVWNRPAAIWEKHKTCRGKTG